MIKKNNLREVFEKKGFRIGRDALNAISIAIEKNAEEIAGKAIRRARISGRKTVRKEDIV